MTTTMTGREHLNWCVDRAMRYFDNGDEKGAMMSFMSDVRKHDQTSWIFDHPMTMTTLMAGLNGGRGEFKSMMEGFTVAD